ncbi:hypothetical protein C9374_009839 [Naegleria lovaniensis]|uniref:Nodulin-like domain-containing protein n=1 Tax=Naegleria lovaniensis TaxID=51637 RepID=A0AA88KGV2_NAELO|nr:uncharacterized protein C9374_009839 [Naegleria lovaniensis]KAG2375216.1 hypothetical protein C9374_009839 [Naegleria lovaniensis]
MKNLRGEMEQEDPVATTATTLQEESQSLLLNSAYNEPSSSTPIMMVIDTPVYGKKKNPILLQIIKIKNFYQSESLRRVRRWVALIIGALVMIACGTQYSFSSISPSLKKRFDLTQTQVNTIGTAANLGTNFSFLFSLVNDFLGCRACSFVSGLCLFAAYFLMSLSVSGALPWAENYIALSIFMFLMGNACGGGYTAAIVASIKNFPERNRGLVVGVMASCFGISSAIYSFSYSYIFQLELQPYMIFCAILGGVVVMGLGTIFLDSNSSADSPKKESKAVEEQSASINTTSENASSENDGEKNVSEQHMTEESIEIEKINVKLKELEMPNLNSLKMLISLDFYLVFLVIFIVIGAGITVINNLGGVVLAYGGYNGQQNIMIIIFSLSNCSGRLIFGFLSDKFLNPKRNLTRITFLAVCTLLMTIVQFLFAVMPLNGIYALVVLLGICYGGTFALTPAFNSERFGPKYFGMNSTIQSMAASLGSYAFSTGMAGALYQANVVPPRTLTCHGRDCYEGTFFILSLLCCIALIFCMILQYRTKWLYATMYRRKVLANRLEQLEKLEKQRV